MELINKYLNTNPTLVEAVLALIVDKNNNRILLGKRKSSSTNLGVGKKCGIGGKLNTVNNIKETPEAAINREVEEEVGLNITDYQYMGSVTYLNPNEPSRDMIVYEYLVTNWTGNVTESDEIEPTWFSLDSIPTHEMFSDNKYWIYQILAGYHIEATFLFGTSGIEDMHIVLTYPDIKR